MALAELNEVKKERNAKTIASLWDRCRKSAVAYGVFATAVRFGSNTVLLLFALTRLSTSDYAEWAVFLALGGFANLADFGFGSSISRVYSFLWAGADDFDAEGLRPPPERGEPNFARLRQFNATTRFLYVRLAFGGTLLLAVAGTIYLMAAIPAMHRNGPFWVAWGLYLVAIGFSLGTSHWPMACQGVNQVRQIQAAYLWSSLAYVASAAILLLYGFGVTSMVIGTATRAFVLMVLTRHYYRKAVNTAGGELVLPDLRMVKRLWPNARKFGIIAIGACLISQGNVLISKLFLEDRWTASIGLSVQLGTFMLNLGNLWLNVKWPEIAILRTQGKLRQMSRLFARRLFFFMASYAVLALGVVLSGNRLLAWKGTATRLLPTPQLLFYFAYLGGQAFYGAFGMLTFTENVVPFFRIAIGTGVAMFLLSLVMTKMFGVWGLLIAPFLAEAAYSAWFTIRRGFQGQPLSLKEMITAACSVGS